MTTSPKETLSAADKASRPGPHMVVNVVYLVASQVLSNAALFLTNFAIVHIYGARQHSSILLVMAVTNICLALSDLGLGSKAGIRAIARQQHAGDKDQLQQTIAGLVTAQLLCAGALALAMALAAGPIACLTGDVSPLAVRLAALWLIALAVLNVCLMIFLGFERMINVLIVVPVPETTKLVVVAACGAFALGVESLFVGWTAAYAVVVGVSLVCAGHVFRRQGIKLHLGKTTLRQTSRLVVASGAFYAAFLGSFALPFLGQLLTGIWHIEKEQVSFFQVTYALAMISRLVALPLAQVLFGRMARWFVAGSMRQADAVLDQAARWLGLLGTLLFAVFLAAGGLLLGRIYGPAYVQATDVLLILVFAIAVENYCLQLDQVLMAGNHVRVVAQAEVLKYAVFVGLACFLTPPFGARGTAMAIAAAMLATAIVKSAVAKVVHPRIGGRPFVATLALFSLLLFVSRLPHGAWLVLPAWLAGALALRLFQPAEIRRWL